MIKNHIKATLRSIRKQKIIASIKIGGLAISITACILIALYINDELGYDKHYKEGERIYRVLIRWNSNGESEQSIYFPAPFAKALVENFPEIENAGRINPVMLFGAGDNEIRRTDTPKSSFEQGFTYTDQSLLDIFKTPIIYGNSEHALDNSKSMVISRRKAEKYFPNENPVGKTMIINNDPKKIYTIQGVIENPPANSHFQYDFLLTLKDVNFYNGEQKNWGANNYPTYILVKPETDITSLEKKMELITEKYYEPILRANGDVFADKIKDIISYKLQPISDIHLYSAGLDYDAANNGDIRYIYVFVLIAIAILLIATINFINISTAKSIEKGKETGLRKTIGASKSNLISFFLTESILYSIISFGIGLLVVVGTLPLFNSITGKSIIIPWNNWWFIPVLLLASVIIGIAAGLYPAFYLSSFKPAQVIKGLAVNTRNSFNTRSALVVFQFAASILLIVGTIAINKQMNYILNKNTGFDKDQILLLHGANTVGKKTDVIKAELLHHSIIENVTVSGYLPISGSRRDGNSFWNEGRRTIDESVGAQIWKVDTNYLETMGIKLISGRNLSEMRPTDKQSVIINQTMANELGLTEPLGKVITNYNNNTMTIIGVVEDFHFESFNQQIGGLCMVLGNSPQVIAVRFNGSETTKVIETVTKIWDNFVPDQAIRYSFLNNDFAQMYSNIKRMGLLFSVFTGLAIIVACLGLLALSLSMIDKRKKEIGIRKVNGAKLSQVLLMLNKDFVRWVVVAFFIAIPIGYYSMHRWLESFAYKTNLSWWIFALAGALSLGTALLTVSWQSWKAATRNPVNALKYE